MWLRIRKRLWIWKIKVTMHSREKNMNLPRSCILKPFSWTLIPGRCGQTEQYVEIQWRSMRMLWLTVCPQFPSTQNALRQVFKFILSSKPEAGQQTHCRSVWTPFQVNNSKRKRTSGFGSVWWSQRVLRIITRTRRKFGCRQELGEASWCPGKRYLT